MALPLMEKNEEDVNVEAGRKNEKWQGGLVQGGGWLIQKMKY